MQVDFYATLRQIVGAKSIEIPLNNEPTVKLLIQEIIKRYPALQEKLLDDDGQIQGHVHININGRNATFLEQGMDTVLSMHDRVSIFPAIGGG